MHPDPERRFIYNATDHLGRSQAMLIRDIRAHHIRIPYDAGVASFKQGASAISALDMVHRSRSSPIPA